MKKERVRDMNNTALLEMITKLEEQHGAHVSQDQATGNREIFPDLNNNRYIGWKNTIDREYKDGLSQDTNSSIVQLWETLSTADCLSLQIIHSMLSF